MYASPRLTFSRCLTTRTVSILICLQTSLSVTAEVVFPPHPRSVFSAEELGKWKADPDRQPEIQAIVNRAEQELKSPIIVPEHGGQWEFYYNCPKDNAGLKALSDTEHQCTACGEVYRDERTIAAYWTTLHHRANDRCYNLALAYALTGDDRFAVPVRDVLLRYATLYPTYERHDRWGRKGMLAVVGGRRYCQHLSEGFGIMKIAKAYDLIYNSAALNEPARRRIEDEFILATAREILKFNFANPGKNNHQTWFNATYAVVGLICGDEKLLQEAVYGPKGFLAQLGKSLTADGIWYEGTIAYHFYALQAMEETVEAARRVGWDLTKETRIKEMFLGPLQLAYPNGQFPAFNDGDFASLQSYRGHYEWAHRVFGDDLFKPLAEGKGDATGLKSTVLKGAGVAVLRQGAGDKAVCVMLDYGEHGEHHGHPDKLDLVLYALGRELVLDPGRLSYSVPQHTTWCRQSVAHNLVVVNGKSQEPRDGKLVFFHDRGDHVACLASGGESYPGIEQRRFLLATADLLVDAFAVAAEKDAEMDWILHAVGEIGISVETQETAEPLGMENGYQHLADLMRAQGVDAFHADWKQPGGKLLRVHCMGDRGSAVFTGNGIGYNLNQKVPFLLRRRKANAACFLTVYDLSGTGDFVRSLRIFPAKEGDAVVPMQDAIGVRIESAAGTYRVGIDFGTRPPGPAATVDGKVVDGFLFEKTP